MGQCSFWKRKQGNRLHPFLPLPCNFFFFKSGPSGAETCTALASLPPGTQFSLSWLPWTLQSPTPPCQLPQRRALSWEAPGLGDGSAPITPARPLWVAEEHKNSAESGVICAGPSTSPLSLAPWWEAGAHNGARQQLYPCYFVEKNF